MDLIRWLVELASCQTEVTLFPRGLLEVSLGAWGMKEVGVDPSVEVAGRPRSVNLNELANQLRACLNFN